MIYIGLKKINILKNRLNKRKGEKKVDVNERALKLHREKKGKIKIESKVKVNTPEDLTLAYTPGVAQPCLEIKKNPEKVYEYTNKGNMVAVVSDGTAVLGLGNIGPKAAIPVIEGKAILFKAFGGIDAFPICLDTDNTEEIIKSIVHMAPVFGGINLEDISAPRCFEIEDRLKEMLDIPIFHDDQHGTAIVVLAALYNSLKLLKKDLKKIKIVINGAGSAGIAVTKLLQKNGVKDIILCDKEGILDGEKEGLNFVQKELAKNTNPRNIKGNLKKALEEADVFVGVSAGGVLKKEMIKEMGEKPILFALANPTPEIMPEEAKEAGAYIIGTGRSDFPNQVNNVLAFPGIFRGALDVRASEINDEMKIASAHAIANMIKEEELNRENLLPKAFNIEVAEQVAEAVKKAAKETGVSRI